MAVVLPREMEELWLDTGTEDTADLTHMFAPYPNEAMDAYEISTLLNYEVNDTPKVIGSIY